MPKLNVTHLPERLQKRIEQLENDEALEARDINALLTPAQQQALKDLWKLQQDLRAIHKPPKTEERKQLLGWKTIREVRLEIYRQALAEANSGLLAGYEELLKDKELRQAQIYLKTYSEQLAAGKDKASAKREANNELTRNKLKRVDGAVVGSIGLNQRDKEIFEMENRLRAKLESELSAEEKEQLALVREYEKAQSPKITISKKSATRTKR